MVSSLITVRVARKVNLCPSLPPGRTSTCMAPPGSVGSLQSEYCRTCGTCLTHVLQGEPEHRDHFLNAAERAANDQFTPCCSRSTTPMLVLDL